MAENSESFQKRKTLFQSSKIEALEREIAELKVKLSEANSEIDRLDNAIQHREKKINNKATWVDSGHAINLPY